MIALARKYRPRQFGDLVAQDHVAAALRGAVAQNRVAHGYLFAGPRGVGKTTAARILAMALNCERRTAAGEPCGACESCTRIWGGAANLDVVELDAASNRGVDDARDLRERAMYAASTDAGSKVYIVDEAHMLTREAWNALLKILEEPPPRVVFVFATTEPQKIAQAAAPILSRLQRFDFRRIGPHVIVERLKYVIAAEHLTADDDALHLIAKSADGGMRDALSLLDQVLSFGDGPVTGERVREVLGLISDELYGELLRVLAERDPSGVFPLVDRLAEAGADLGEFVSGAGDTLRAVLLVGLGGTPEDLTGGLRDLVGRFAPLLPPPDVVRLLTVLGETEGRIRGGGQTRLAVEVLLLRWTMMGRTVELEQVLKALGQAGDPEPGAPRPAMLREVAPSSAPPARRVVPSASPTPAPVVEAAPAPVAPPPAPPAPEVGPLTLERLQTLWPRIVVDARTKSQMLGALLGGTEVAAIEGGTVTIRMVEENPVHADGIERQREAVAQLVGRYVSGPVRVVFARSGADAQRARPARLTEDSARAERLSRLKAADPALGAAVDALDLELLE